MDSEAQRKIKTDPQVSVFSVGKMERVGKKTWREN